MCPRLSIAEYQESDKFPLVVVLEDVRSGLNVGSIFRSADSFRVQKMILGGYTPCPPHREVLKTALGATESVNWEKCSDVAAVCSHYRSMGYLICAIEQENTPTDIREFDPPSLATGIVIVLGNEVKGVSPAVLRLCDQVLEVVQYGTKQSLNVSVCAGIALFELTRKMTRE